jgi:hypothetical protein
MTLADQEWVVKLALLDAQIERLRIAQAAQRLTRAQIVSYYWRHQRRFFVPEHRDVAIIETPTEPPIRKAKREIESGKDFADVARRVSTDPRAPNGQKLYLTRSEGATLLTDAIFGAKPHVLIGPLLVIWFYLFDVLRIVPAHELSLAQAQRTIVQILATEEVSRSSVRAAYERKWVDRTVCQRRYVVRGCSAHVADSL